MNDLKLKPCPFCGGQGEIRLVGLSVDSQGRGVEEEYRAVCRDCGAQTGRRHLGRYARVSGDFVIYKDAFMAAVEDWNRRTGEETGDSEDKAAGGGEAGDKNAVDASGLEAGDGKNGAGGGTA